MDLVKAGDPEATTYLVAGHSYLWAKRWINSGELLVVLSGHFDNPPAREFKREYRVNVNGTVRRLSTFPRE